MRPCCQEERTHFPVGERFRIALCNVTGSCVFATCNEARGVSPDRVAQIAEGGIDGRDLGFLGEPRDDVLVLNLALDQQFGAASAR